MLLDDVHHIRRIDKGNMMARIVALPQHISETLEAMADTRIPKEYSNCKYIVVAGMGGSGIPGDFLRTIYRADCPIPIVVHKNYGLPPFVNSHTLVLTVSYSGTTEETIDAFREAQKRKAKVFGVSSGDQLLELLRKNGVPHFAPPAGLTTRECFGYLLFSLISVLAKLGYVPQEDSNITHTVSFLGQTSLKYAPETGSDDNEAKRIALALQGKIPMLYGSVDLTDVVGLRWKHQLNENSKVFPQLETFPDVTHNQLAAIVNAVGMGKRLCAVLLRNNREGPELSRRINGAREVLAGRNIDLIEHWAEGASLMASLLTQSYLGDFVSLYLAVLNGVDPTPTIAMSELKKMLGLTDLSPQ